MYFKRFKMKKRKGFTLVEMVIVVVILGILSSMALMKYNNVQENITINMIIGMIFIGIGTYLMIQKKENAKKKADYATASTIATATIVAMNDGQISGDQVKVSELVSKGYLQSDVKCNSTGKGFDITINGDSVSISSNNEPYYPKPEESSAQ